MKPAVGLFIMVRYPTAGSTKTRLAASLGEEPAAEFQRACAELIFRRIKKLPGSVRKYIFFAESGDSAGMREWVGGDFSFKPQLGDNLGQRLKNAFTDVFGGGAGKVVTIASDTPDITADIVKRAVTALNLNDVVIGPCEDGGYYLLGMNKLHPELFRGISWSTRDVLGQTLSRAQKLKLKTHLLPTLLDIDTIADLKAWLKTPGRKDTKILNLARASKLA